MPICTRKGCGKEFSEDSTDACTHHPGAPVFHEGLKSWSCCKGYLSRRLFQFAFLSVSLSDVNKPVLEFDEFMKMTVREQVPF